MKWLGRIFGSAPDAPAAEATARADVGRAAATVDELRLAVAAAYDLQSGGDAQAIAAAWRALLPRSRGEASARYLFGLWLTARGQSAEAIPLLQEAAAAEPDDVPVRVALGRALIAGGQFAAALPVYREACEAQPDCAALLGDHAGVLMKLERHEEALPLLERQRRLSPQSPEAYFNLGVIHCANGHADDAIAAYREGLERAPRHAPAFSNLLLQMNYSARATPRSIWAEHRRFGERFAAPHAVPMPEAAAGRRLRVGYVSPDFREHVVMRFMEGILANHDDERFEIVCYHTHAQKDALTERLRFMAGRWVDAEGLAPEALAARIRADGVDVLVDLAGHTAGNSLLALAHKPAPLQLTYLGYPNTTGLTAIDARLSDAFADPPGEADRYSSERIVRLPGSYFCYRPNAGTPPVNALPATRAGHVTFGCFNNFPKLSSEFLDAAAEVLASVPGSRLLLKNRQLGVPRIAEQVREHFGRAGTALERVELRGWTASASDHLSIYHEVDIALDSFPYNGATTTCEALYMGVPVVSLAGDRHAGRMGASLLNGAGLGHLVAHGVDGYVAVAAALAADLPALAALRTSLRERLQASPLMDEAGFTRRLEECYRQLWQECLAARSTPSAASVDSAACLARARALRSAAARSGGELTEATDLCHAVLRAEPANAEALTLAWDLAFDTGSPGAAIEWLNRALAVQESGRTHYMLGCVLQAQGRLAEAAGAFTRALALDAKLVKAENNLGCVHEAAGHLDEAEAHYRRAIALDPQLAQAHYNLGNLLRQRGLGEAASESFRHALRLDDRQADWHANLGEWLAQRGQWDEAIDELRAALRIDPGHAAARLALADAWRACGALADALDTLSDGAEASPLQPDFDLRRLLVLQYLQPEAAGATRAAQRRWHERHARLPLRGPAGPRRGRATRHGPLHVGYLLPPADSLAVAAHLAPWLAAHDRSNVRVHGYAIAGGDARYEAPLRAACAVWRDLAGLDDDAAVLRLRADGIDVLVDLLGTAPGARPGLLARQAARVQCSWPLAAPGVVLPTAAVRLGDAWLDPEELPSPDDGEVLRLAGPALCYAPPAPFAGLLPEVVASDAPVLFGWLGAPAELSASLWAAWAAILQAVPQAQLRLGAMAFASRIARAGVLAQAEAAGVDAGRLLWESSDVADPGYFTSVDIALDSFPVNGLGSCAALWMGVPVVALAGSSGVTRRAASILAAADAAEGLVTSSGGYVRTAVQWAAEVAALRAARRDGARRVRASALADARALARHLERAYGALTGN